MKTELLSGPARTKDGSTLGSTIPDRCFVPVESSVFWPPGPFSHIPSIIRVTKGLICRPSTYVNWQLESMREVQNQRVRRCMHEKWYSE